MSKERVRKVYRSLKLKSNKQKLTPSALLPLVEVFCMHEIAPTAAVANSPRPHSPSARAEPIARLSSPPPQALFLVLDLYSWLVP